MLSTGDKVTIIFSSLKGKGAKIKRNSTGYISSIGKSHIIQKGYKQGVIVTPAQIVFNKYGNEKKTRCESKFVALVYPFTVTKTPITKEYFQDIVDFVRDCNETLEKIFSIEGINIKNVTCVTILAEKTCKNILKDENEFLSCTRSILGNVKINLSHVFPNEAKNKTLKFLKGDSDKTSNIIEAATLKNNMKLNKLLLDLFNEDKDTCRGLLSRLRAYSNLERMKDLEKIMVPNKRMQRNGIEEGYLWRIFLSNPNEDLNLLTMKFKNNQEDEAYKLRNRNISVKGNYVRRWVKTLEKTQTELQ